MSEDPFAPTPLAPPDSIFQLTAAYKADSFKDKVNLGVGAYRDDQGKPWVLPVVKKVKTILAQDDTLDHEYLPIAGLTDFIKASPKLILGKDSPVITEGRTVSLQTISGTGANHLGGLFLSKFYGPWIGKSKEEKIIYLSNPTWANHRQIFGNVGLTPADYPYYSPSTISLDFPTLVQFLSNLPSHSVILLHGCAHNPTGVDPTPEQWSTLCSLFLEKSHFAFFDCAYQGFASGDLDNDAYAVRLFAQRGVGMLVCQSFAKNAGLYGERVGCLTVVAAHKGDGVGGVDRLSSQLSVLQRSEISNPPTYGARIVSLILNDPQLFSEWETDIKTMAHRIIDMRHKLWDLLTNKYKTPTLGNTGNWDHIKTQIGMFSFTGLNPAQSKLMVSKAHVYLTANGRISMAGLNNSNVDYVAKSIDAVIRGTL